jgi:PAS domain S-box-containing protein
MKIKKYAYKDAKKIIKSICSAAEAGEYDTRKKFMAMLDANPDVAAQGYNAFGKIFFWNDGSAKLYGYNEAAAINKDLFEIILPPELRQFARDMVTMACKTGKLPEAASFDLLRRNGEYVTVFSGHLMFQWDNASSPEFYCIDLGIESQTD